MIGCKSPVDVTSNLLLFYHNRFIEVLNLRVEVRHTELISLSMEVASGVSQ